MKPSELRRALRDRKKALRRAVAEKMERIPEVRKARNRKRVRRGLSVLLVLLLASFMRCECQKPAGPQPVPKPVTPPTTEEPKQKPKLPPPKASKQIPLDGELDRQARGRFQNEAVPAPDWLEDFRLQVSARSNRLAQCFTGRDRPGALRWSAAVNASSGAVSDHALEPVGAGGEVSSSQRECLLAVLSKPVYQLKVAKAQVLPERVSIVIEF